MSDLLVPRLNTAEVCRITTWSRWTLKRKIADGSFPRPERLGNVKHDVWRKPVIEKWLEDNTYIPEIVQYATSPEQEIP